MTKRENAARIRLVDVHDSDSATLLKFHREILGSNFHADQMVSEEALLAAQRSDVLRTVLAWDDKGDLVGGLTGEWYPACRIFLLDYLAVSPDFRGGGVGSALLRHGLERWSREFSPIMILGEVEDPRSFHDTEFGDPQLRFRLYGRLGARVLRLPYFQPALGPRGSRVPGLLLMVFVARPDAYSGPASVAGMPLDCFIRQYVTECEGPLREDDAELDRLLSACRGAEGVPLLPVGALPAVPA